MGTWKAALIATSLLYVPAIVRAQEILQAPNCSLVCMRQTAVGELSIGRQPYDAAVDTLARPGQTAALEGQLEGALKKFDVEQRKVTGEIAHWEDVKRATELSFAVKDDIPGSDVIPTSTYSATIGQGIDDQISALELRRDALGRDVLGPILAELRQAHQAQIDGLAGKDSQTIHDVLFGPDGVGGLLAGSALGANLDPGTRADIANLKADMLREELAKVSAGATYTQVQVQALIGDYVDFKRKVDAFAKDTTDRINGLTEGQRRLNEAYRALAVRVADNTYRLDALEGAMWGKLTANEKIEALKGGAFSAVVRDMTPAERKDFEEDLEFAATLEDIDSAAGAVGEVAESFRSIGALVGLDLSEPVERINQGVVLAQSLVGIASGNPLAVISGLGGVARVFGPSRSDGTSAALNALRREIQQMRVEMRQYHMEEMEALEQISRQIDRRFAELAGLQRGTLDQIGFNTLQLDEVLRQDLDTCALINAAWRPRVDGDEVESFDARAARINLNHVARFVSCRNGVTQRFFRYSPDGKAAISTIFSLQTLSQADQEAGRANKILAVQRYRDETLAPTVAFTLREQPERNNVGACNPDQVAFAALLETPKRDGDLRTTATKAAASCKAGGKLVFATREAGGAAYDVRGLLLIPISASNVLTYGRAAFDATDIYEFLDAPGGVSPKVMTLDQMRALAPIPGIGRKELPVQQLNRVLELVNISIAQINALSGDLVLEVIAKDLEAGLDDETKRKLAEVDPKAWANCDAAGKPSARYFNALCLLQRNEALRYNFTRHWVRTRLGNPQVYPLTIYAVAVEQAYPDLMAQAFSRSMPTVRCEPRWCLKLPGAAIKDPNPSPAGDTGAPTDYYDLKGDMLLPLPAWHEVASDRQAVASPQLDALLRLRRDIVLRLAEMNVDSKLTLDERRVLYAAAVIDAGEVHPLATAQ